MVAPTALISGVGGQDGAYLARFLIEKGYNVHGIVRRASTFNRWRIDGLDLTLHYGDMIDAPSLLQIIDKVRPDEVYNLAAQSHVGVSFETPVYTAETTGLGTLKFLESLRILKCKARFYQASTSELYGNSPGPQDEETPFAPRSPYAAAKLYAYWVTRQYREAYGVHASNGILFNHESPFRGENFVTQKVCRAAARGEEVQLGNLNAVRDWGHARDYVEGMWLMLQQEQPDDYVLATGVGHTVWDLCKEAYGYMGMEPKVKLNSDYVRPLDVDRLIGNPTKAKEKLGWSAKTTFKELIAEMMEAELDSVGKTRPERERTQVPH